MMEDARAEQFGNKKKITTYLVKSSDLDYYYNFWD